MAGIEIRGVSKAYRGAAPVVEDISIDVVDGEFLVLVGPSGSGKSTLLRMIAGLEEITGGEIRVDSKKVNDVPPRDRDLAMVFQNYALYPHMTVEANLAFALKLRKTSKGERRQRVDEVASLLGLEPYLGRKPSELSGGQRQRVAMGRAIVRHPKAFLMDEPLSNLDARLRVSMRGMLSSLHERLEVTTIYVTHDQVEAMTLGDRVAVLADGKLQQIDTPQRLYDAPTNVFVAGFIGSPAMNLVEAQIADDGSTMQFGSHSVSLSARRLPDAVASKRMIVGIRPSDLFDSSTVGIPSAATISSRVTNVEELGSEKNIMVDIDAPAVDTSSTKTSLPTTTEEQTISVGAGHSLWTARLAPSTTVQASDHIRLGIDVDKVHFFDPSTGVARR